MKVAAEARTVDRELRIALTALRAIVAHERSLKGTIAHDPNVWTIAYTAVNTLGYLDKPLPSQSDRGTEHG